MATTNEEMIKFKEAAMGRLYNYMAGNVPVESENTCVCGAKFDFSSTHSHHVCKCGGVFTTFQKEMTSGPGELALISPYFNFIKRLNGYEDEIGNVVGLWVPNISSEWKEFAEYWEGSKFMVVGMKGDYVLLSFIDTDGAPESVNEVTAVNPDMGPLDKCFIPGRTFWWPAANIEIIRQYPHEED